jgi:hypothetical protein
MKFYNSLGPNPRCVRMFMAEKAAGHRLKAKGLLPLQP